MDCGPTCVRMIAKYYGRSHSIQSLRDKSYIDRQGVSLKGISSCAESIGFRTLAVKVSYDQGEADLLSAPLPAIAHWNQNHFVVIYKANKKFVWIADPAAGKIKLSRKDFMASWAQEGDQGILLLFETTPAFYDEDGERSKWNFIYLFKYLRPYTKLLFQLFLGLLLGLVFQLIFPFLTQSVVDFGIQNNNINFIYLILAAQLILFISQMSVQFLQRWIILHVNTRVNVSLISDFLLKLMRLPIGYFDSKNTGDLLQRIGDHNRIEQFLTGSSLQVLFSSVSMIVFGVVLFVYNPLIFGVFAIGAFLYILWIVLFLRLRKKVDYLAFQQMSDNNDALIEIIQGMPEIKLQNSERKRRWNWTHIQAKLFRVRLKSLAITQYQDAGAMLFNQLKDIIISFIAAKSVIDGQMTLGMMMAVQYIVGQVNGPLNQLIQFIRSAQDAKISLERLGEIHGQDEEETDAAHKTSNIPNGDIMIENLQFKYSPISDVVLENVDLIIPRNKVTAIVGVSGSGKTTLVKLLLGFYNPTKGSIKIGQTHLANIRQDTWRAQCGAVMQDGYIFSDTIARNIAESDDVVDRDKLMRAVNTANIQEYIEALPLSYNTVIGAKGSGISQGQRQRILIARAVYKDPEFIFFDEATNSLDANNEKVIMQNLNEFFEGRTVVVVAHRLSTVKNADQIVVLDQGKIVEMGSHQQLVRLHGSYYTLVKNQLELGN